MKCNVKGDGNFRDSTNFWSAPATATALWFKHLISHTWKPPVSAFEGLALLLHQVCETEEGKKMNSHL